MAFINRKRELAALDAWWDQPGPRFGVVWGRRRVGKSFLISHWARDKRVVFHVARNRSLRHELGQLSQLAHPFASDERRDLTRRPFADWDDLFDVLTYAAKDEPLLLVIDEFAELLQTDPNLESTLRALWERVGESKLRILLTGSAVRAMEALQAERAPLFGRATLRLQLRPFTPGESALMLPNLSPAERAKAWGVCGGTPYYLALWDDHASFELNLERLVCTDQGILLNEGELVLATEDFAGGRRERTPEQVLRAIAAGRTKFSEIKDAINTDPTRPLQALRDLNLIDRVQPVRAKRDARRSYYRIADNFLAFWLSIVESHRPSIAQGLGSAIGQVMRQQFDDFMGDRWEEAFRAHLTRAAPYDDRLASAVEVGQFWKQNVADADDPCQIDAVVLTGRSRTVSLVGEAKWGTSANGQRLLTGLRRKARESGLPLADDLVYALCARETVTHIQPSKEVLTVTADDIFSYDV